MQSSVLNDPALGDVLATAAATSPFNAEVLEKDLWVVWTLQALFHDPELGRLLGFKGGTSLSKAYRAITRFSEDVDLTVDRRAFGDPFDPLSTPAPSNHQLRRWRERVETTHSPGFLRDHVLPRLVQAASALDEPRRPRVAIDPAEPAKVLVTYPSAVSRDTYLRESVLLEFGGRMPIEPIEKLPVQTYLQEALPSLGATHDLPTATPQVVHGARTFWENLKAIDSRTAAGPQPGRQVAIKGHNEPRRSTGTPADRGLPDANVAGLKYPSSEPVTRIRRSARPRTASSSEASEPRSDPPARSHRLRLPPGATSKRARGRAPRRRIDPARSCWSPACA